MRLQDNPQLPQNPESAYDRELSRVLQPMLRQAAQKVNQLASGGISAVDNAQAAIPTTGMYAQGDVVRNSLPVELGTVGSKYVLFGWICVAGGSPGTLLPMRFLTGN